MKSFSQKDIYDALKKEEMGKTAKIIADDGQQPLGRSVMFETLKKRVGEEPNLLVGVGDQQPLQQPQHSNANIFKQLKQKVANDQKDEAPQQVELAGGEPAALTGDNLPTKTEDESTKMVGNDKSDILHKPDTAKMVDNKLLKDFRERFTEENGFQSVQSADEMLNDLQNLALNNQKQIDAHQANGDFYKSALTSKRQEMEIASGSNKRHQIAEQEIKITNNKQQTATDNTDGMKKSFQSEDVVKATNYLTTTAKRRENTFIAKKTFQSQNLQPKNTAHAKTSQIKDILPTNTAFSATNYATSTSNIQPNFYYNQFNNQGPASPPISNALAEPKNQNQNGYYYNQNNNNNNNNNNNIPAYYYNKMQKKLGRKNRKLKKKHAKQNTKNNRHLKLRKHKLKTFSVNDGARKETVSYFSKNDEPIRLKTSSQLVP